MIYFFYGWFIISIFFLILWYESFLIFLFNKWLFFLTFFKQLSNLDQRYGNLINIVSLSISPSLFFGQYLSINYFLVENIM